DRRRISLGCGRFYSPSAFLETPPGSDGHAKIVAKEVMVADLAVVIQRRPMEPDHPIAAIDSPDRPAGRRQFDPAPHNQREERPRRRQRARQRGREDQNARDRLRRRSDANEPWTHTGEWSPSVDAGTRGDAKQTLDAAAADRNLIGNVARIEDNLSV